jgi:hypothetical protein
MPTQILDVEAGPIDGWIMPTPEEAAAKMRSIADGSFYASQTYRDGSPRIWDKENQHSDADGLLCEVLRNLGYNEMVDVFESMDKWYA